MTEKNRGEAFETYPYPQPDPLVAEPESPAAPAHQPALPEPLNPVGEPPPKINRRKLVVSSIGAGLAGLVGYSLLRSSQGEGSGNTDGAELPPEGEDLGREPIVAELVTTYTTLGCEVPLGWEVTSEGEYLKLDNEYGALAAREPERRAADVGALSREADYLSEGFDPDDQPAVFADQSDTRFTVLTRTRSGRFGGTPATEQATLFHNRESGKSLVVWWVANIEESDGAAEARGVVRELRRGFEDT